MSRAISIATNLAVAVAATAVGCMTVVTLAPGNPDDGTSRFRAASTPAAAAGPDGSAARAATSALGIRSGRPGTSGPAGPDAVAEPDAVTEPDSEAEPDAETMGGRIEVTAPPAGLSYRPHGSLPVAWRNSTGQQVDVWLNAGMGHGRPPQRLAVVAPKAGDGPTGEALVTLPQVPPGPHYFLEVATAGDGTVHAFSKTFAITG
ncbi:hypothetical protein HEK616_44530 [Streptomyces nigrescens]|uniref:Uncharacterized protein n=2 Tax=Streptomyces TaxID=1883 RepID=A0ABN6QZ30_STRNI|nr:hypothetical protein [Streptomyces nigrescens]MEE4420155.1 hypothetical protein [Streptomyces sp. DSM 41528]BDM70966.1 hypothetical protein HEK616_44530 [Streptomyces nigrescens]